MIMQCSMGVPGLGCLSREGNVDHPGQAALIEGQGPCRSQRSQIARLQEMLMKQNVPGWRLNAICRKPRNKSINVMNYKQA